MAHTVVSLLAERPEDELRKMLARTQDELQRLQADVARAQFEAEQLEQALARQNRRESQPTRRGETREQVLRALASIPGTASPSAVIQAVLADGEVSVSAGAIRNMIGRLVEERMVERVGEGEYRLASRAGSESEPSTGPTENGEGRSLVPTDPSQSRA